MSIIVGTNQYNLLSLISDGVKKNVEMLANVMKVKLSQAQLIVERLEADGYLSVVEKNSVEITDAGILAFSDAQVEAVKIAGPRLPTTNTHYYSGAELKLNSARPGAYDAYNKPSIINGVRVERVAK